MDEENIAKVIQKKCWSLGIPLSTMLRIYEINRSTFERWVEGIFKPSKSSMSKLTKLKKILTDFEEDRNKNG